MLPFQDVLLIVVVGEVLKFFNVKISPLKFDFFYFLSDYIKVWMMKDICCNLKTSIIIIYENQLVHYFLLN